MKQTEASKELREHAIKFAKWINSKDTIYAPLYDETWCTNERDGVTAEELYSLFTNKFVNIKK